jgi:hypothetical protein
VNLVGSDHLYSPREFGWRLTQVVRGFKSGKYDF